MEKRSSKVCHYNPDRDICAVDQSPILSLSDAFANGLVPDNVSVTDSDYDGCEEPNAIVGRPANEFEAIHMGEAIKAAVSEASAKQQD